MIEAYPLAWPEGWKRTPPAKRKRASFGKSTRQYSSDGQNSWSRKGDISVTDGTNRILGELNRLGIIDRQDVVISSNVRLRLDGLPRSGEREPDDPGVAVYWTDRYVKGAPRCMAIDRYDRVADNLAAVAATIEAMRAIERHGGAEILNRAFTGFTALPAPGQTQARGWREILGFAPSATPSYNEVERVYRTMRSAAHPDKGGSHDAFMEVQTAFDQAHKELCS
jgi:hypothetical protein